MKILCLLTAFFGISVPCLSMTCAQLVAMSNLRMQEEGARLQMAAIATPKVIFIANLTYRMGYIENRTWQEAPDRGFPDWAEDFYDHPLFDLAFDLNAHRFRTPEVDEVLWLVTPAGQLEIYFPELPLSSPDDVRDEFTRVQIGLEIWKDLQEAIVRPTPEERRRTAFEVFETDPTVKYLQALRALRVQSPQWGPNRSVDLIQIFNVRFLSAMLAHHDQFVDVQRMLNEDKVRLKQVLKQMRLEPAFSEIANTQSLYECAFENEVAIANFSVAAARETVALAKAAKARLAPARLSDPRTVFGAETWRGYHRFVRRFFKSLYVPAIERARELGEIPR